MYNKWHPGSDNANCGKNPPDSIVGDWFYDILILTAIRRTITNVGDHDLRRYFQRGCGTQEGNFRVKPLLRDMIEFRRFNLMEPFPFREVFDVTLCRNVMIYFHRKTQQGLIDKFYHALSRGGYLFIGHSETLAGIRHSFRYIMPGVYQKQ